MMYLQTSQRLGYREVPKVQQARRYVFTEKINLEIVFPVHVVYQDSVACVIQHLQVADVHLGQWCLEVSVLPVIILHLIAEMARKTLVKNVMMELMWMEMDVLLGVCWSFVEMVFCR
tara:strand:- start:146 stop:496 length:351 start_codon:yes stop_codon:yes gene_type:complete